MWNSDVAGTFNLQQSSYKSYSSAQEKSLQAVRKRYGTECWANKSFLHWTHKFFLPIIKFILILQYLTTECTFFIILGLVFVHSLAYQDFLKVLNIAHIYTVRLLCIQRNWTVSLKNMWVLLSAMFIAVVCFHVCCNFFLTDYGTLNVELVLES